MYRSLVLQHQNLNPLVSLPLTEQSKLDSGQLDKRLGSEWSQQNVQHHLEQTQLHNS